MPLAANIALYRELSKSGIVALVLISVLGGYLIGHPFERPLDFLHLGATLAGILFLASGSSALNQWQEWRIDLEMPRTAKRPIPSGRISSRAALVLSLSWIAIGLVALAWLSPTLLVLGAMAVVSYNFLYTLWWKKKMAFAAVPGAIPGAIPILMGHAAAQHAATGADVITPGGVYLFSLLFFWQMPHFWVLALKYSDDYARGGIPTLPVARGARMTVAQIVVWCFAYVALALGASLFVPVGSVYLAVAIASSAVLLWELRRFALDPDNAKPGNRAWLRFFLWVNFTLIFYIGGMVVDQWSIYLIRFVKG